MKKILSSFLAATLLLFSSPLWAPINPIGMDTTTGQQKVNTSASIQDSGSGTFVDTGSVQSITGAKTFSDTKLLLGGAGAGVATLTNANTATSRTITIPDPGANSTLITLAGSQTITGAKTFSGADTLILPTAAPTTGTGSVGVLNNQLNIYDGTSARIYVPVDKSSGGIHNLGLKLSAGAISITGLGNTALASTNSAWVSYPSSTAASWLSQPVTADQTIASGGIKGRWGTTASVAWGSDMPMFVGVTSSDNTAANIRFFITRNPAITTTPSSTNNIGIDGTAPATSDQGNIVLFGNAANTGYNSRPCRIIGSFRGTIDNTAGGVMTVTALDNGDGIGVYYNAGGRVFTMPISQNGATSGKYLVDNGGTAPTYTAQNDATYKIDMWGNVTFRVYFSNAAGGTAGAGAVGLSVAAPYKTTSATNPIEHGSGFYENTGVSGASVDWKMTAASSLVGGTVSTSGTTSVLNSNQSAAGRQIGFSITYAAF